MSTEQSREQWFGCILLYPDVQVQENSAFCAFKVSLHQGKLSSIAQWLWCKSMPTICSSHILCVDKMKYARYVLELHASCQKWQRRQSSQNRWFVTSRPACIVLCESSFQWLLFLLEASQPPQNGEAGDLIAMRKECQYCSDSNCSWRKIVGPSFRCAWWHITTIRTESCEWTKHS